MSTREAKRLRVYVGESDKLHHTALHEAIVRAAREAHLTGATAWRGLIGFGRKGHLRTDKALDLSSDLPVIVEMVDTADRIDAFVPVLQALLAKAGSSALVTVERVEIVQPG